jgi:transglutaminase-like putative cysteine protease
MTRYRIKHVTTYRYSEPVTVSHNVLHLAPISTPRQHVFSCTCHIEPQPSVFHQRSDYFGNNVHSFTVQEQHTLLRVTMTSDVEVNPAHTWETVSSESWENVQDLLRNSTQDAAVLASEFCHESRLITLKKEYGDYASASFTPGRPIIEAALDFTQRINRDFIYDNDATSVHTTVEEIFTKRRGVCQDFAHIGIACLRSFGLAARYVSGYLETEPPPGQEKLIGVDASHAWLSIWCSTLGWVAFDPTNACLVGDRHVIVAVGRDFDDVSPTKGVILGGGMSQVSAVVDVVRQKPENN